MSAAESDSGKSDRIVRAAAATVRAFSGEQLAALARIDSFSAVPIAVPAALL